jgi:hypothetical protein
VNVMRIPCRTAVLAAGLIWLAAGCGGGGGGGTDGPLASRPDVDSGGTSGSGNVEGGTSGTGVAGGGVNGFGSVIVNGVAYRTSADDPTIETSFVGPVAGFAEADLAPGMLVQVDWRRDSDGAPREAERITYLPELIGPVTDGYVHGAGGQPGTLTVAGRTVAVTAATVIDDPYARRTAGVTSIRLPAEFSAGNDRVEVSGYVLETDPASGASGIQASRIARVGVAGDGSAPVTVSGIASDSVPGEFRIVDTSVAVVTVAFDAAVVQDEALFDAPGSGRIADGAAVRVTGNLGGDALTSVSDIRRVLDDLQPLSTADSVPAEIVGPITVPPDDDDVFRVDRQRIRFDSATDIEDVDAVGFGIGRVVRVIGELQPTADGGRILQAERIVVEPEPEVRLEDVIADGPRVEDTTGNRTFRTRIGVTVQIRPTTILKDDDDLSADGRLDQDDLRPGDAVEVLGYFAYGPVLVAVKLEREDGAGECELEARVRGSEVVGGSRYYTIAQGLVIADVGDASTELKVRDGRLGEFEVDDAGNCDVVPSGVDTDGVTISAGFLADDIEEEDDIDLDDD